MRLGTFYLAHQGKVVPSDTNVVEVDPEATLEAIPRLLCGMPADDDPTQAATDLEITKKLIEDEHQALAHGRQPEAATLKETIEDQIRRLMMQGFAGTQELLALRDQLYRSSGPRNPSPPQSRPRRQPPNARGLGRSLEMKSPTKKWPRLWGHRPRVAATRKPANRPRQHGSIRSFWAIPWSTSRRSTPWRFRSSRRAACTSRSFFAATVVREMEADNTVSNSYIRNGTYVLRFRHTAAQQAGFDRARSKITTAGIPAKGPEEDAAQQIGS